MHLASILMVSLVLAAFSATTPALAGLVTEVRRGTVERAEDPNVANVTVGARVSFEVSIEQELLSGTGVEMLDLLDAPVILSFRIGDLVFDESDLLTLRPVVLRDDGSFTLGPPTRGTLFFEDGVLVGADLRLQAPGPTPLLRFAGPNLVISSVDDSFCVFAASGGCDPDVFAVSDSAAGRIRFEVPEPAPGALGSLGLLALVVAWRRAMRGSPSESSGHARLGSS